MFTHTSIRTSNMDRSIDFYTRLLGLKLQSRHDIPQNNAEIAFLQDPERKGSPLELTLYRNQKKFIQAEYEDRVFDHLASETKHTETPPAPTTTAFFPCGSRPFASIACKKPPASVL